MGTPVSSSWGLGRLDLWAAGKSDGVLYHNFWAPDYYHGWEKLGGEFDTAPQVVHWGPNRIDIVGRFSGKSSYAYKFFDGFQWMPSFGGWITMGGSFASEPAAASWGEQSFHILGLDVDGDLKWKFWQQDAWYPKGEDEYYSLGNASNPYADAKSSQDSMEKAGGEFREQVLFNGFKQDI